MQSSFSVGRVSLGGRVRQLGEAARAVGKGAGPVGGSQKRAKAAPPKVNVKPSNARKSKGAPPGTGSAPDKPKPKFVKPELQTVDAHVGMGLRLYELKVAALEDPGKDDTSIHPQLLSVIAKRLGCSISVLEQVQGIRLTRKSLDARNSKTRWDYVMDVPHSSLVQLQKAGAAKKLVVKPGWIEMIEDEAETPAPPPPAPCLSPLPKSDDPVVVVGSGPAGLFAALSLASAGVKVVVLERGQPVEQRGRDIGALFVRGKLNPDSNLCYGEGGAGTWSDGKLTTRIGRNGDPVRRVLQALVQFGAPESILVSGKPHLGTERLVKLLKEFRAHLQGLGVSIRFGSTVRDLVVKGGRCSGVVLTDGDEIKASAVVLAVGHSARNLYQTLQRQGVALTARPFAMGFRVEHPQSMIDQIQYGREAAGVMRGKGRLPVADYVLAAQIMDGAAGSELVQQAGGLAAVASAPGVVEIQAASSSQETEHAPSSSSSSSSGGCSPGGQAAAGGSSERGVYSFCMCPGGQIVPTSTSPEELCINGMSFSRRNSLWANSALVVTVRPSDWEHLTQEHGQLAGVALQVQYERLGAVMGGGNCVAPVQRVADFMAGSRSTGVLPSSSYRLGVRAAELHQLYAPPLTSALQQALQRFDRRLPGFAGSEGLLHGVETRTSSPVKIDRLDDTLESVNMPGLFPCGEGAGYAGGIMSAAVDGLKVGEALAARVLQTALPTQ